MTKKLLKVVVYADRQHVGKLTLIDGGVEQQSFEVAAKANDDEDTSHPEPGRYRFLKIIEVPTANLEAREAYGPKIMYFMKEGSTSQDDVLILHGGDLDDEGKLVATDGGLRLANDDFQQLMIAIGNEKKVQLELEEKELGFLRQFTKKRVSDVPVQRVSAPSSSSSSSGGLTDNIFFWMWLYDSFSSHSDTNTHGFAGFGSGGSGAGGAGGDFTPDKIAQEQTNAATPPLIVTPYAEEPVVQPASAPQEESNPQQNEVSPDPDTNSVSTSY